MALHKLSDIIVQGALHWPTREAVADASGSLTYAELAEQSARVAAWLVGEGIRPGDRVAVHLPNSVRFVVAHFGVQSAGAVSVPLDPALTPPQVAAIIASAEPKCSLDANSSWGEIEAATPLVSPVNCAADDLAALMFTTGTTGQPKGVMLTHANIFAALRNIVDFIGYTEQDREVITLPLSHNFGLGHVYCNLLAGGAVYLEPGLARVGRVLKAIKEFGATGFPTTPLGIALLLDRYGEAFAERAQRLRFMVVNSAPLPPERAAQLQALLPQLNVLVYYGLTEASRSTFISLTREGPGRYRSVGRPMKDVDLQLDADGQVLIGGPTVTPGYWRDLAATESALSAGVLHTGDLGRFDADGYLYITGRIDDIINFGGYKINPLAVERVLEQFPGLSECAVVGSDSVVAYYVAASELDADALTQYCRGQLQVYETPTQFVRIDHLPRTESGKLKRKVLISGGG
ncbi:class I adenylate-forming enzyme family protein [Cerasicoccus arenae]|uniref:class I adenylate-forming enzyme family protein n=1 Tax=Cerasicoccus arenae TaxID=424488 RepID=UPI0016749C4A|nr:class I adenylate-forming enzyme family protein [Cerasicoccus arenae]